MSRTGNLHLCFGGPVLRIRSDSGRDFTFEMHPVARLLDDGWTVEVNRLATDGCPNACSLLYGVARRVAKEMGYAKLITYIRGDEPGLSLKASGWEYEGPIRARSWDMPGRRRKDKTEIVPRGRWSIHLTDRRLVTWPLPESLQVNLI